MNALATIDTRSADRDDPSKKTLVLLIEDERTQRMVLRTALEREGFLVEEAPDGYQGLQAFDTFHPDIVLLDVRMPVMDGFATCAALRRRPGGDRLPILMLTVLDDSESINRAYDAGATDFITKPIAWPVLGHRLRYMLRASDAFQSLARSELELAAKVAERTAEIQEANVNLEAANKELEAFTFSVSHDLRVPLRAVHGFATLLQKENTGLGAREQKLLERIVDRAQHMSSMIDDLLRFSSISRGSPMLKSVDLDTLVVRSIRSLRADFPHATIKASALTTRICDAGLMQHVFDNLIGNALKYSSKRDTPVIEIGMENVAGENVFFVRDNGAGFDMTYAQSLFGVFRRFHSERDFSGTGVGLAIVRRIIERHHGRVWAKSAPQAGATFYFTLGDVA